MTNARRSRTPGPLRAWAGDSLSRKFLVWLLRSAVSLAVLAIGLAIIWFVLTPMMIDGVTRVLTQ
jgi:hypothetical protein